jgi:2-amino-4-hydroxy-6-hydroxymethyldihydropteridine diphosphokinase
MTVRAFVAIGSNVGDRRSHCREAQDRLGRLPETALVQASELIETAPQEGATGGPFLNGVAELETSLSPEALLRALQEIESALGRPARRGRGTPRTMDLDILLYGDCLVRNPASVPHPGWRSAGSCWNRWPPSPRTSASALT